MTLGFGVVPTMLVLLAWVLDRPGLLWPAFLLAARARLGLSLSGPPGDRAERVGARPGRRLGAPRRRDALGRRRAGARGRRLAARARPAADGVPRASRGSRSCSSRVLVVAGTVVAIERLPAVSDLWDDALRADAARQARARRGRARVGRRSTTRSCGRGSSAARRRDGCGRSLLGESTVAMAVLLVAAVLVNGAPPPVDGGSDTRSAARRTARSCQYTALRLASAPCSWRSPAGPASSACISRARARRRRARVRTLDLAPLDDAGLERPGRGAPRRRPARPPTRARLVAGADVLVHAAAALPIQVVPRGDPLGQRRGHGRDVLGAALEAGVRRVVLDLVDRRLRRPRAPPDPRGRPARRRRAGTASRRSRPSGSAGAFGRRGLDVVIVRPKTFVGPERLGVFEILFDWIREGRRIPILGDGDEPLPAARGRGSRRRRRALASTRPVGGEALNVGAGAFGTVREDLEALIDHAGSGSRLRPVPARPAELALRGARARAALAARRVALPDGAQGLVRLDRQGARRCSAGSRGSRTPRRCARPTTGTSRTSTSCAARARRTACRGTSRRSGCSSASADRRAVYAAAAMRELARLPLRVPDPRAHDVPDQPLARGDAGGGRRSASPSTRACGSERGIRAWGEGWWTMPMTVGDQVGRIIGAPPGTTVMHQNVAVAEAVVLSCFFPIDPARNRVVYERENFPSVRYLYQAQPEPRGRRLRGRRGDRRRDRRAHAARPDQPRPLQDRRDPGRRADHAPGARGRRARDPRLLPVGRASCRSTSPRSASTSRSAARSSGSAAGPGNGWLYVRPDLAERLEPTFTGWQAHERAVRLRGGDASTRRAPRASSPARRTCPRSTPRRRATT